jgi:MFS family permease
MSDSNTNASGRLNPGVVVVLGVLLGLFCSYPTIMGSSSSAVFLKPTAAFFGWERSVASLRITVSMLAIGIASPFIGRLIDLYGELKVIRWASIGVLVSFILLATQQGSVTNLIVVSFIAGLCGAGVNVGAYLCTMPKWFDRHLGRSLSFSTLGLGAGMVGIPVIAQFLIGEFGWRWAYVGLGVLTVVAAFASTAIVKSQGVGPIFASQKNASFQSLGITRGEAFRTSRFWCLAISALLVSAASIGAAVHMVALFSDHQMPAWLVYQVPVVFGVGGLCGRFFTGLVVDRVHAGLVAAVTFLAAGAALLVLALTVPSPSLIGLVPVFFVGLASGAESDLLAFMTRRYFGDLEYGAIYNRILAIHFIGPVVGPFAMGYFFDRFGGYHTVLIAFAVACGIGAILMLCLGPYRYVREQKVGDEQTADASGEPAIERT